MLFNNVNRKLSLPSIRNIDSRKRLLELATIYKQKIYEKGLILTKRQIRLLSTNKLRTKYKNNLEAKKLHHRTQIDTQRNLQRIQRPMSTRSETFTIEKVSFSSKYNAFFDKFRVVINHPPVDPVDVFVKVLQEVVEERSLVQGDYIRLIIGHMRWYKRFSTKLFKISDTTTSTNEIQKLLEFNEYKSAPLNEIVIEVQSIKLPRGQGRLQVTPNNLKSKRSIITIKNSDSICLARSIVTALANINKKKWTKSQLKNGFNDSRKLQEEEAKKLHYSADVPQNDHGSTLEDVNKFAEHLGIQNNIVDSERFNEIIHTTSNEHENGMIYLYKSRNHFDIISSMPGLLSKDYYCHDCKKSYTHRDKHKCESKCIACFKYGLCRFNDVGIITCNDCNRQFFGKECYDEHKRNRAATPNGKIDIVCEKVQKCLLCKRTVSTQVDEHETHVCGFSKCSNCLEYCDQSTHKCYMVKKWAKGSLCMKDPTCQQLQDDRKVKLCYSCKTYSEKYMFYDFETTQDTGVHIVNWVHAWDFNGEEHTFDTIDEFCKFVFDTSDYKNYTFIAHNAKAFDNQFILKYCIENGLKPYTINNGTKIMYMNVSNRTFLDSINFVNGRLANFPKTFGFKELKKGYFPHYFNTPDNQGFVGPIPDIKYYSPDQISPNDRETFMLWHQTKVDENYIFDFTKELRDYCRSDVDILRRSMMQFRDNFIEIGNIDPLQYVTIASVCMAIFRSKFLKFNQIAVRIQRSSRDSAILVLNG